MPDSLLSRIVKTATTSPDRLALECRDGTMTYGELLAAAQGVARQLPDAFAQPRRIGIVAGDDCITYAALLGIWLAGHAYTPLNKANPARRNEEIIRDAGLSAVLSSEPFPTAEDAARQAGCPWMALERDAPTGEARPGESESSADPERLAYILFTSGTTGRPKGVPIRHRHLDHFAAAIEADSCYRLTAADRWLQMFELGFDLSAMCIFVPWSLGASVHVVPHKGISYFNVYRTLASANITVALMVPSVLSYLSRFFDEMNLPALRYSLFCGEGLPQALAEGWADCVPNALIQNTYGPTEATILCYVYRWEAARARAQAVNGIVPIGHPVSGMGGLILDSEGHEAAPGVPGELCLYGAQVTDGYWNDPQKSEAAFFQRTLHGERHLCYRTGDLASRLPDGEMVWRGRTDHQVKIDGHRVELAEIEAHAREVCDSAAVAAVAPTSRDGHYQIVLFVEGGGTGIDDIASALALRLPAYMRPSVIRRLEDLPLNANGKIDRPRLTRDASGG